MSNLFSERLKRLRGSRSKSEFARLLGLTAQVYQRYEDGRVPRADTLSVIAERLNVSVKWLLSGDSIRHEGDPPQVGYGPEPGDKRLGRDALARLVAVEAMPDTQDGHVCEPAVNEQGEGYATRSEMLARIALLEDQNAYYRAQAERLLAVVETLAGAGREPAGAAPPASGASGGARAGRLMDERREA